MENYDLLMSQYVEESSAALAHHISNSKNNVAELKELFKENNYSKILIVACGSSSNASYCAIEAVQKLISIPVEIITPFSFVNYHNIKDDEFIFVISQSGYSTNAIEALEHLKANKRKAIGITGNVNSDYRKHADVLIDYKVGEEKCVYVTKGVVTLTAFLIEFALELALDAKTMTEAEYNEFMNEFKKVAEVNKQVFEKTKQFIKDNYMELSSLNICYSIGAGSGHHMAYESALKLGETLKIPSVAYEVEEFIHGSNLQLTPNYSMIFFDVDDSSSERITTVYKAAKTISNKTFIITNNKELAGKTTLLVEDNLPSYLKPMAYLPFVQQIAYQITTDTHKWPQHPLLKEFKKIAVSKSNEAGETA